MTLRYVKMVEGSRLYDILIKRQFNEIVPEDCNVDDILTELVIKVLLLALQFVRFYFWSWLHGFCAFSTSFVAFCVDFEL